MKQPKALALLVLFVTAFSALVFAAANSIDKKTSAIEITFKQEGVPVSAKFNDFSGSIDYDPANIAAAKAQLVVQLTSFDIGDDAYNKEVQKKTWFDTTQFPQATFTSASIKALGADKLQAQGKLVIKGRSQDITVPITLKQNGNIKIFSGSLPIKRLYFNIGDGEWRDTDVLADEVIIKFSIATNTGS
ncbi:MAG: signal peptide protein [Verrucomicrobiaceae bacterium]|nr:signal peptide protein [Verrucomicrobiaceae bacterium]